MLLSVVYETVIFARGMEVLARLKNPHAFQNEEQAGNDYPGRILESDMPTMVSLA